MPLAANNPLRGACSPTNNSADNVRYVRHAVRGNFRFSLRQAGRPGARSLRKRPRGLSAPRLLASGAGLSRFRLSQVVFSTALTSKFVSSLFVASPPPGNSAGRAPAQSPVLRSSPRRGAASASAFPLLLASAPASFRCGLKPRLIAPPLRRSRFSASLPASPSKFFYPTSTASRPAKPPRDRRNRRFRGDRRPRFSAPSADLRTVASARLRAVPIAP